VVEDFGEINGVQICTNRNGAPNVQTNDYTLQFTDGNTDLFLNKATPLTLTLPKEMPLGWECWLHQEGVGAVPFATASGATLEGETGLTTQYSAIHLVVRSNADGVSAAYRASGAGSALIEDTIANILAMTPTLGSQAYATDLGQTLVADGSSWNIDSSYYTALSGDPDIGLVQWSNRIGYGKDYVTDKVLANCSIGYGSNSGEEGDFRYSASTHVLQIYSQGAWKQINIGVPLRLSTVDQQLESETSGGQWLRYFGDSEILGLNGLPIVQGGHVSMGAYPVQQVISGGTF
jgi:hypothetical protein